MAQKKEKLQDLRKEELEGLKIRTRTTWLIEGEKPSKYLSSLQAKAYIDKTIKKLVKDDGSILTDQKAILKEVRVFYTDLFKHKSQKTDSNLLDLLKSSKDLKKLSPEQCDTLEHEITISELGEALKNMKNGKTPGIDGFPAEFFKVFWGQLKYFILRSAKLAYEKGMMSCSFRHCVISCIPKGDKDRTLLKNWRPISLLSVIYKMLSTVIACRIKSVLNAIISPTQTGFLPGRFIGENTRLIYDLLHYTQEKNISGLLLLIDFKKAFDSVSWDFLYKLLKEYNFGPNICKWVELLNTNIFAYVCQYGVLSEKIRIERGCRQGDPLSVYLFLLCAEVLCIMIKLNQDIKGIEIKGKELKISQFADDTTLILNGECGSLQAALNTLEIFGNYSGLIVNTDKTQVIWIGKKRGSKEKLNVDKKLFWGSTCFSLLGVNFTTDLLLIPNLNYSSIIGDLPKNLLTWGKGTLQFSEEFLF